jgi:hypothetical protein
MQCKKGDTVYYPKFGAHALELEDEDYVVMREADLFAIIPTSGLGCDTSKQLLTELKER